MHAVVDYPQEPKKTDRLSTVRRANEILVLDHGRVVERGSYDRLMAAEGPFRRLAADLTGTVPGH